MRPARVSFCALGLLACSSAQAPAETTPGYHAALERAGLRVEVIVNPGEPLVAGDYDILVSRGPDLATRLNGMRRGELLASTLTDLDGDGKTEVVVLFGADGPQDRGHVRVYEWNDLYLDPVELPAPPALPTDGYRGHDRYRIEDGALLWEFPRFDDPQSTRVNGTVRYRYDFKLARWHGVKVRHGWLGKLPFIGD
jgi:hypothetical protein